MRIYQPCCVAVLAAITFTLTSSTASAEDGLVRPVVLEETTLTATGMSFEDQIIQLESRIAMLESRPTATAAPAASCNPCPIPSRRIATNSLCNPEHYAGFELAVLKPYTGSLSGTINPLNVSGSLIPGWDFEASPRIFLGRERSDGLGFRATYWQFDQSTDNVGAFGITTGLEMHAFDLELTSRKEFYGSDTLVSAGIRYGYVESGLNVPPLGGEILNFTSEGVGPTIGARMRRGLGRTKWDLVIGGRASLLLTDASVSIPTIVTVKADDSTMQVWEGRIAAERTFDLRGCAQLVTQFGFEAQNWQSGSIVGLISPNFGLAGPTFRVGLNF